MSGQDYWDQFHARRARLRPPLRPDQAVVDRLAAVVAGHDARVLMLGLTPELAVIGHDLTIADWNERTLRMPLARDPVRTRSVAVDWRDMAFAPDAFTAVIGDGGMTMVPCAEDYRRIFARLVSCLVPGARLALRCFVAPDQTETLDRIREAVLHRAEPSFHALKWRIAMALAARCAGQIAVSAIVDEFDRCFPDRAALCAQTDWDEATLGEIDSYRGSDAVYTFFTRDQLFATLPPAFANPRLVASGAYPLAERSPFLVADLVPHG